MNNKNVQPFTLLVKAILIPPATLISSHPPEQATGEDIANARTQVAMI